MRVRSAIRTAIDDSRRSRDERSRYATRKRAPFFELAGDFLPASKEAIVVDIGAGDGSFAEALSLDERFPRLVLLEGNRESVTRLQDRYSSAQQYEAPEPLPFDDGTVAFVHCSHLVEHLQPQNVYSLLAEIDRVLESRGVLVISAPLLSRRFYADLSHVRPYEPEVLMRYLSNTSATPTREVISTGYHVERLVERYDLRLPVADLRSDHLAIDLVLRAMASVLHRLRVWAVSTNGYTIVLRKSG